MRYYEIITETSSVEVDVYHGTTSRFKNIRTKPQYDVGYPAIFTTTDKRFASMFADGKDGKLIHFKLDTSGFADFTNMTHLTLIYTKLSEILAARWRRMVTLEEARDQLRNRLHDGRLDWSYHFGMKAIWQAGFTGAAVNDAYNIPSFVSFNTSSLRFVGTERPERM